jgi:hypothetical protein
MGIAFYLYMWMVFIPHEKHTYGLPRPVRGWLYLLYVDGVHTSQETPTGPHACYGDGLTFVYVDGVRTSQETHTTASTASYVTVLIFTLRGDEFATISP